MAGHIVLKLRFGKRGPFRISRLRLEFLAKFSKVSMSTVIGQKPGYRTVHSSHLDSASDDADCCDEKRDIPLKLQTSFGSIVHISITDGPNSSTSSDKNFNVAWSGPFKAT
jgi:hypothetical protein